MEYVLPEYWNIEEGLGERERERERERDITAHTVCGLTCITDENQQVLPMFFNPMGLFPDLLRS